MYPKPLAESYQLMNAMTNSIEAHGGKDKALEFLMSIEYKGHAEVLPILEKLLPKEHWTVDYFFCPEDFHDFQASQKAILQ